LCKNINRQNNENKNLGTIKLIKILKNTKAETIIGGGDTAEIINKLKIAKAFSFVSTGGGATLDFLSDGKLVGMVNNSK
jgi:phosphoglycerate kinase